MHSSKVAIYGKKSTFSYFTRSVQQPFSVMFKLILWCTVSKLSRTFYVIACLFLVSLKVITVNYYVLLCHQLQSPSVIDEFELISNICDILSRRFFCCFTFPSVVADNTTRWHKNSIYSVLSVQLSQSITPIRYQQYTFWIKILQLLCTEW